MEREYRTTSRSIWVSVIALPFTAFFAIAGVVFFAVSGFSIVSIGLMAVGVLSTLVVLNNSWSRTTVFDQGLRKTNLLTRSRRILWIDVHSWHYMEDSDTGVGRVEFLLNSGQTFAINMNEAESLGIECLVSDLRNRVGGRERVG